LLSFGLGVFILAADVGSSWLYPIMLAFREFKDDFRIECKAMENMSEL
jgi:hypothetical protein